MSLLDLMLVAAVVLALVVGYGRGALLQIASIGGTLVGLFLGALAATSLAKLTDDPWTRAGIALGAILVASAIGNTVGSLLGHRVRRRTSAFGMRRIDQAAGSGISVLALLLVVWFLGPHIAAGPFTTLARQVRDSQVVSAIDSLMPAPPPLASGLRALLDRLGLPDVFVGIPPQPAPPVRPPSGVEARRAFRAVRAQTVKIVDPVCGTVLQGTGFVVSNGLVATNAHVIAGGDAPEVIVHGKTHSATVVVFDPRLDVAILRVPSLSVEPVEVIGWLIDRGRTGAVAGYPGDGGLVGRGAAVGRSLQAVGRDIYGQGQVKRHLYELQARVRPGNSGGPFALQDGRVAGMVFASSPTEDGVAYAIASPEWLPLVERARGSLSPVDTGPCMR